MGKNIAFYISDHNMEHCLRTVPILQNMRKIEDEVHIFVKSGKKQMECVRSFLESDERIHFHEMEMRDREIENWEVLAENEEAFLKKEKIGLIVSDICPWIFLAADELRIRSILLANYTWAELCDTEEEKEEYLSCYELASRIFIYDFHVPELTGYGVDYELVSMMNRPYNMEVIGRMAEQEPFVFLDLPCKESQGADLSHLPYSFVITEGSSFTGKNVQVLPQEVKNRQDYVAASRFLITYGTWNRIAEAVLSNRKAAYVVQEDLPMSRQMVGMLAQRGQGILIEEQDLFHIDEIIERLEAFTYSYDHEYYNSDYDLAKKILFAYPEKRRRNRS